MMNDGRILLLPGNMCDRRLWDDLQIEASYGDLSRHRTIREMAETMLAEHDGPLVPIGFSMGAIVAMTMALLAPTIVKAVGLIGFNATADLPERAAVRPRQQADVRAGRMLEIVSDELNPRYFSKRNRNNAKLGELTIDMASSLGEDVFVNQSEALRTRSELCSALPSLECPVLLACGNEDELCPPDWHMRWASEIGCNAMLATLPNSGHMLPLEQPVALQNIIDAWRSSWRTNI